MAALAEDVMVRNLVQEEVARQVSTQLQQGHKGEWRGEFDALRTEFDERLSAVERRQPDDKVSIVVFSGDMDRVLAAFVVANGAIAMGMEVSMFFTFWGLAAVKKSTQLGGKAFKQKLFSLMTPAKSEAMGISKLNFLGMGPAMMKGLMKEKNVASVSELRDIAREMDTRMLGCTMSMDVMGVDAAELIDGIELGGVAAFMEDALNSRMTLFI